jgi:hypothetical protein
MMATNLTTIKLCYLLLQHWTKPGDIATNPSPRNSANSTEVSTRYLKDGSYISIRNITLAYELPQSLTSRWKLDGITLSLSADNVYTFTKFGAGSANKPLYRKLM